jgi:SAM-dependent methyltransferase
MTFNSISDIDFEAIWANQIKHFSSYGRDNAAGYWDRRAQTFSNPLRKSSYTNDLLQRMELHRSYSVLDVGCGSGIMAIPMAGIVRKVTAIDISSRMLDILKESADRKGVRNIHIMNKDWTEVIPGQGIPSHDVVLASRCLSGPGITDSLRKIDMMAKRTCYITWRAGQGDDFEIETYKALGWEYHPHPEYAVIWNVLYSLGIRANLEIFESIQEERYPNLEQAVTNLCRGETVSDRIKDKLATFVENRFSNKNGYLYHQSRINWALIWWQKREGTNKGNRLNR